MRYQIIRSLDSGSYRLKDTSNMFETYWHDDICVAIGDILSAGRTSQKVEVVYEFDSKKQFREDHPEEFI